MNRMMEVQKNSFGINVPMSHFRPSTHTRPAEGALQEPLTHFPEPRLFQHLTRLYGQRGFPEQEHPEPVPAQGEVNGSTNHPDFRTRVRGQQVCGAAATQNSNTGIRLSSRIFLCIFGSVPDQTGNPTGSHTLWFQLIPYHKPAVVVAVTIQ